MEINYVKQMNAFLEKSVGVLGAREQAVYLRLFGIWNKLQFPECFDVADSQLARELSINRCTVIKARKELRERGFISFTAPPKRKPIKYRIFTLYDEGCINFQQQGCIKKQQPLSKKSTTLVENFDTSKTETVNNISSSSDDLPTTQYQSKSIEAYLNNIEPLAGSIVLDQLKDLVETYTDEWVLEAVKVAAASNVHSIRYINGILQKWQRNGFKAERKKRTGGARPKRLANESAATIRDRVNALIEKGATANGQQNSGSTESDCDCSFGIIESLPAIEY